MDGWVQRARGDVNASVRVCSFSHTLHGGMPSDACPLLLPFPVNHVSFRVVGVHRRYPERKSGWTEPGYEKRPFLYSQSVRPLEVKCVVPGWTCGDCLGLTYSRPGAAFPPRLLPGTPSRAPRPHSSSGPGWPGRSLSAAGWFHCWVPGETHERRENPHSQSPRSLTETWIVTNLMQ